MSVVISCLAEDFISKNDLFRVNALSTLPNVLEKSNLVYLIDIWKILNRLISNIIRRSLIKPLQIEL